MNSSLFSSSTVNVIRQCNMTRMRSLLRLGPNSDVLCCGYLGNGDNHTTHRKIRKRTLVTQINATSSLLRSDNTDQEVYLLGTAHISKASAKEAVELISLVRPQKVLVELDARRAARLRDTDHQSNQETLEINQLETSIQDMMKYISQSGLPVQLPGIIDKSGGRRHGNGEDTTSGFHSFFRSFYQMLRGYGYVPGIEMLAAMKEADRIGAEIVYGDQEFDITLQRLKASLSPQLLLNFASAPAPPTELQLLFQQIASGGLEGLGESAEMLKTRDNARLLSSYMDRVAPDIGNAILHERDIVIVNNLKDQCRSANRVVAVVGLAHVDGIERAWQNWNNKDIQR